MIEIGRLLKKARTDQKLSIEEMAARTKIHINKLKAIEAGDSSALPAKVFCVGLIKSYARELRVDSEKIHRLCEEAFAPPAVEAPEVQDAKPTQQSNSEEPPQIVGLFQIPKAFAIGGSVVVSLLLLIAIYAVYQKMAAYSQEEEVSSIEVPIVENTVETPKKEVTEPEPKPVPATVATTKPKPNKRPATTDPAKVEVVKDTKPVVVRSDNKLVVLALEPVRMEVVWSDGFVQTMLLKSQEKKTFVFSTPLKLRVNNGGAIRVNYNKQPARVPGSLDQPIELSYP